jgi:NAD(P)H-flavin reductase
MAVPEQVPNPYRPSRMVIDGFRDETPDVRTLRLRFVDPDDAAGFAGWEPGQFGQFTVFGAGESVFALSNAPWRPSAPGGGEPTVECTFRTVGKVTSALHALSAGQVIGFRGPYGNHFPLDAWKGKQLVFIGGGIGMAALRSALLDVLRRKQEYRDVLVLNGARTVDGLVYKDEMSSWQDVDGVRVVRTVDPGGETGDWDGEVGLLPNVFEGLGLDPEGRIVVACGPPVMLRYLFLSLDKAGYSPDQVVTTLENKMKCGIGHCGRCYVGPFSVCRDGPVVTWAALNQLPKDY